MDTIKPLYTATATSVGGRNGHTKSSDGIVSFVCQEPRRQSIYSLQAYAACFGGAMRRNARRLQRDRIEKVRAGDRRP